MMQLQTRMWKSFKLENISSLAPFLGGFFFLGLVSPGAQLDMQLVHYKAQCLHPLGAHVPAWILHDSCK